LKAILSTEIARMLDREKLTARARTGIAGADFSRIRNADLSRFTIDRLMSILNRLEVKVRLRPAGSAVA
jgi:predicted XRE-type DNA-binding protein